VATATKIGKLVAGAAKGAVARIVGWWRARSEFTTAAGEQHALYFQGEGRAARLVLASEPRGLREVLADEKLPIKDRSTLQSGLAAIDKRIAANADIGTKDETAQNNFQKEIAAMVQVLASQFASRLDHVEGLPASTLTFGLNQERASFAMGMPLTKNPGNTTGAAAGKRLNTEGDRFVGMFVARTTHERTDRDGNRIKVEMLPLDQAHLINAKLHGPFSPQNIALGDKSLNRGINAAETEAIKAKEAGEQIQYKVDVEYHSSVKPPADTSEIAGPVSETVRSWTGFYIAKVMRVTWAKWLKNAYSLSQRPSTGTGDIPAVTGEVIESIDDMAVRVARGAPDPSLPEIERGGAKYFATQYSLDSLRVAIGRKENQMRVASERLRAAGRVIVTIGPKARVYIRK
jgi:hypothetical protein